MSHVAPGAVAPGTTTELTIVGAKLSAPLRLWTSFPATIAVLPAEEPAAGSQIRCRVTLPANVAPAVHGIAAATSAGASDIVYLMVDGLPSVADSSANDKLAAAQEISLPAAIDGASSGTLSDYFRFSAKAGQRVSGEVVAGRLGWDFDPLVRVLDAAGHELLLADDDPATGVDARFIFTAPTDGQYFVELRDNRFKAGGRYRLRLGDFPLVTTPLPLVVQRGAACPTSFLGPHVAALQTTSVLALPGERAGPTAIGLAAGSTCGWASVGLSDFPVHIEADSPDEQARHILSPPCVINGELREPRERDRWRFQLANGTSYRWRAISRSLGSAAVASLKLTDAAGKQVAASPVTDSDEPVLTYTASTAGEYVLTVEELAGRGGSDFGYAVECRSGPQFSLALKNDKNNRLRYTAPQGGAIYLDVQAQRAGYDGPITLTIDSPTAGWQVFGNVIAAKSNETRLFVVPPADLPPGAISELRVVGRGWAGDQPLAAAMATTVQLRAARPHFPYPPAWHDGAILVSTKNATATFYAISSPAELAFDRQAGQARLAIEMERLDPKFKDTPLSIVPLGLPPTMTAEIKRGAAGTKETYELILKGPTDLPAGQIPIRYFAYAELAGDGQPFCSGDVRLRIEEAAAKPAKEAATP